MKKLRISWKPLETALTARAIPRPTLLAAADQAGFATVNASGLAAVAGVSTKTAARWLRGHRTSQATDRALRRALGLADEAA